MLCFTKGLACTAAQEERVMQLHFVIPSWVETFINDHTAYYQSEESQMRVAIDAARNNINHHTGGPFGAAIFDEKGKLVSIGINLVTSENCSILHAEMVAIALAQQSVKRYDLSDGGIKSYTLASSTEPCAMCFGALPWSGITRLLCGARDADARQIGFDEGPKHPDWEAALLERGIAVSKDILRSDAVDVLHSYMKNGGEIYNAMRKK